MLPLFKLVPFALMVVSEDNNQFYLFPTDGNTKINGDNFSPCTELANNNIANTKLAADTPFAEKCGALVWQVEKYFGKLAADKTWALAVSDFITKASTIKSTKAQPLNVWPPLIPFSASSLINNNGLLAVFSFKGANKAVNLDKIDYVYINNNKVTRTFWSRNLNDPTSFETFSAAIEKTSQNFIKSVKANAFIASDNNMRLVVDVKIKERDLLITESIIKSLYQGPANDVWLFPYEVNKFDIRYQMPLPVNKIDEFIAKLQSANNNIIIKKLSAEAGMVQILPNYKK